MVAHGKSGEGIIMVERCDFYSDEEYEFALATEENEQRSYDAQREYMEMQAMYADNQLEC